MKALLSVFYSKPSFYKRISLLSILFALLLTMASCGGSGGVGGGAAAPGGINLPAPTADVEAGPADFTTVCDSESGAPSGAFVKITNTSNPNDPTVQANLDANGSFSVWVCIKPGDSINVQVFDSAGNAISPAQTLVRTGNENGGVCPNASNNTPTCP
jgi:hypothetical protein